MFDDFKELLSIFNAQKVKYLIVGGYAVSLHAQPRATKDIDLLIRPEPENSKARILDWLRAQGRGYQTRINYILRVVMENEPQRAARRS